MQTIAKLICGPAQFMAGIADESVDLIVTSPPYPMVEMWDEIFARPGRSNWGATVKW